MEEIIRFFNYREYEIFNKSIIYYFNDVILELLKFDCKGDIKHIFYVEVAIVTKQEIGWNVEFISFEKRKRIYQFSDDTFMKVFNDGDIDELFIAGKVLLRVNKCNDL